MKRRAQYRCRTRFPAQRRLRLCNKRITRCGGFRCGLGDDIVALLLGVRVVKRSAKQLHRVSDILAGVSHFGELCFCLLAAHADKCKGLNDDGAVLAAEAFNKTVKVLGRGIPILLGLGGGHLLQGTVGLQHCRRRILQCALFVKQGVDKPLAAVACRVQPLRRLLGRLSLCRIQRVHVVHGGEIAFLVIVSKVGCFLDGFDLRIERFLGRNCVPGNQRVVLPL